MRNKKQCAMKRCAIQNKFSGHKIHMTLYSLNTHIFFCPNKVIILLISSRSYIKSYRVIGIIKPLITELIINFIDLLENRGGGSLCPIPKYLYKYKYKNLL